MLRSTLLTLLSFPLLVFSQVWSNHTVAYSDVKGTSPYQRHECAAGLCQFGGNDYCIVVGGRGNFNKKCPIIYDRAKDSLYLGNQCPQEVHHFQASVWRDSIIVVGMALTNGYPGENPVSSLYLYHAKTDTWEVKTTIPTSRRRGSAQSVIVGDWVYFFNGITQGHISGWVNQADRYNLTTNTWEVLLPTPRARDHALAFHVGENIYLVGGRRSNYGNAGGLHGLPV
ncbi:MAG: hypothetical protein NWR72_18855, partial [Bacteroidia bacterium]|nr:hypothetical protein [Bacteroidia bacterium]